MCHKSIMKRKVFTGSFKLGRKIYCKLFQLIRKRVIDTSL